MIPDFQSIMLPLMQHIADGNEHSLPDTIDVMALHFKLSEEDLNQYSPNRNQTIFHGRVRWARNHLKGAGLLETTRRGHFAITEKGKEVLSTNPNVINMKFLHQFSDYLSKKDKTGEKNNIIIETDNDLEPNATPEEIMESNYIEIRKNLSSEILSKIKSSSPAFFENLVVELLVKMGYGGTIKDAGKSIGRTGDEGIDGIIKEDRLGLDLIYVQAKRWENVVGRPEIQKFVGALAGQGAKKGVFITTSRFTNEAKEYQPKNEIKIVLIDGEQLADLMIDFDLAVSMMYTFTIKRIDNDYFEEQ